MSVELTQLQAANSSATPPPNPALPNFLSTEVGHRDDVTLLLGECRACGARTSPPEPYCFECGADDVASVAARGNGLLYAFTLVHTAAPGFSTPFYAAYVDLPEGVRVFGHLESDGREPTIGAPVMVGQGPVGVHAEETIFGTRFKVVGEISG